VRAAAGIVAVAAWAAWFAACGGGDGDSVCGNGVKEDGEDCDDGNMVDTDNCTNSCRFAEVQTLDAVVKWAFNKDAAPRFDVDSCFDMGVSRVEVEIQHTTDTAVAFTASETCGLRQVTFIDIPAGDYLARVRAVDTDGNLMTNAVVEQLFTISSVDVEIEVVIPYEAWKQSYTGTFFFRLHWGDMGIDCAAAAPPVARHRMTLERGGTPVTQRTDANDRLDGTAPGMCRSLGEEFPQSATGVPWGPYMFHVEGLDSTGTAQFMESYDTFVGAGVSNPEMQFDVRSLNEPDAGVPDAGLPDA
jgi:cysteine-rich repeat protein